MTPTADVVFLFDCDNTLLDNDRFQDELSDHLVEQLGSRGHDRYWELFEQIRSTSSYADYLGALQRYRLDDPDDTRILPVAGFLLEYPFADRLYPGALDVLGHFGTRGPVGILSDGDVVFQPRKLVRSGLWAAVAGRVLIYIHKETMLPAVAGHFPANHYVMVDDKLRVLAAMKRVWGNRLTTIFVRQGHYALDDENNHAYPAADVTVEAIGDLLHDPAATSLRAPSGDPASRKHS